MKFCALFVAIIIFACACTQENKSYKAERAATLALDGREEFEVTSEVIPMNKCSSEFPWM
ncbi:hypothetical protein A2318_02965 [Candidatus Uhrbacteria bacterium RIFOXYB2_FULL_45_11]|uniref:Uncharacterized protein n=1 Tax=Candidatus Uhrbacteria bacterium RIFOXYB2_FULL_45_11 TaxID=1802421 RepID=A0A1F7W592_9BACT|nr:MAG: hypothetical protein A2318_02965 [Candidatus Uhrbacteria bacterium RIFOXYB2_FULL_45_11]